MASFGLLLQPAFFSAQQVPLALEMAQVFPPTTAES